MCGLTCSSVGVQGGFFRKTQTREHKARGGLPVAGGHCHSTGVFVCSTSVSAELNFCIRLLPHTILIFMRTLQRHTGRIFPHTVSTRHTVFTPGPRLLGLFQALRPRSSGVSIFCVSVPPPLLLLRSFSATQVVCQVTCAVVLIGVHREVAPAAVGVSIPQTLRSTEQV